jgi:hypothetical protein
VLTLRRPLHEPPSRGGDHGDIFGRRNKRGEYFEGIIFVPA